MTVRPRIAGSDAFETCVRPPPRNPFVRLIGVHDQIVRLGHAGDNIEVRASRHDTGGVLRRAHQNPARAWCDPSRERIGAPRQRHGHGHATAELNLRLIADEARILHQNLVTGIERRHEREEETLLTTECCDELALGIGIDAVVPLQLGRTRGAKLGLAPRHRLVGVPRRHRLRGRLDDIPRRVLRSSPRGKVDDVDAVATHPRNRISDTHRRR